MKTVVITGSSKGIGLGMAKEFLKRGCNVVMSSYAPEEMAAEFIKAQAEFGEDKVAAQACDVTDIDQLRALWDVASEKFGPVDIWMNNAGIANTTRRLWELDTAEIPRVVSTNLIGVMFGTQVALQGMLKQGHGQIFNTEGFGSDDMLLPGLSVYGSTKRAVRYFTESMYEEVKTTPVLVGTVGPGIVVTDFLLDDMRKMAPEQLETTRTVYNILADELETVTPWLVDTVLSNTENGERYNWLTEEKANARFEDTAYLTRDLFSKHGL